jgi:hypothetical protein
MNENNSLSIKKIVLSLALGVIVVYVTSTYIINKQTRLVKDSVQVLVSEQASVVSTIAEITSRGGADSVAEAIIVDCPSEERTQFDNLLGKLNQGIRVSDLRELDRLFNRCGSFFSDRKAVMVSRLDREVSVLNNYVGLLSEISGVDKSEDYKINKWNDLVEKEKSQSRHFNELVTVQGEIIVSLLNGNTTESEEIASLLAEVSSIQSQLSETVVEASELRSELISL